MDPPPGANRAGRWLQVAVRPVVFPAGDRADLPRGWRVAYGGWRMEVSSARISPFSRSPQAIGEGRAATSIRLRHPPILDLLDLAVFELDRRRPAEDRHRDLEARARIVDFLDHAAEGREGAVRDADLLADLEADRGLRAIDALRDLTLDAL